MTMAMTADAKWWIFGKSGGDVGLKYLQVNRIASDETGTKITVFRETLSADGLIRINGRASAAKGAVGSVRVSLDDKATWSDVKFSDNGTFEFAFKPEQGKTYKMLVEVTDTAGKTNKVEETRKEISLSDENIQAKVRAALDALFDAYNRENLERFMVNVGEDFAGDKAILERAVKRDFDALSNINMRYTVNNVSAGAQGRVFVSVTYNRMVFINKTGASSTDTGVTEFVFDSKEGKLALFSMKKPLMFGLSDPDVGTGTVIGGGDGLVIDDSGDIGSGLVVTKSYTNPDQSFGYNIETETFEDCDATAPNCGGHLLFMPGVPYIAADDVPTSAFIGLIAGKSVSTATQADAQAAAVSQQTALTAGSTYGLKYGASYYAVEVTSLSGSGGGPYSITIKTKAF
ncbi:MAG: hypothetical protein A2X35_02220 [Elusimicrobia bacterium GWA2_61_42]|nr:MAG: hypothetical protein A2X35_02220 [Elusimicrobia bacterium GWA2_61_42]OGR76235.1 MAG: hypothetical protein A2X38_08665 [Elusimicrobia bacterium GWC2_61_25]